MAIKNTITLYGTVAKTFHWLIFLLLTGMLIFGYCLGSIPKPYVPLAFNIHKLTGLTILTLMVLRAIWTSTNIKPALPSNTPLWQHLSDRAVQYALYLFIIAMPLAGWIGASASGKPPHIGNVRLSLLVPHSKSLSGLAFDVHNTVAIIIIALLCIHVTAAFYHYFIRKDDVLQRMLP